MHAYLIRALLQEMLSSEVALLEAAARNQDEATKSSLIELQMRVQTSETEMMQAQQLLTLTLPASSQLKLTEQVQMLVRQKRSSEEKAKSLVQVALTQIDHDAAVTSESIDDLLLLRSSPLKAAFTEIDSCD